MDGLNTRIAIVAIGTVAVIFGTGFACGLLATWLI